MAGSGSSTRKLDAVATVRMTTVMLTALAGRVSGRSVGDHIRELVAKDLGLENLPVPRALRKAPKSLLWNATDVAELRNVAATVAKAIGMLKVCAQTFREAGERDLHASAETTLAEMQHAARAIHTKMAELGVK